VKEGRFVPAWAADAGLVTPLPVAEPDPLDHPEDVEDLVDLLLMMQAGSSEPGPGARVTVAPDRDPSPPPAWPGPPAREIAIELD
jgi:hypothetical protein